MSKLSLWIALYFVCLLCAMAVTAWPADTFTTLASFDLLNGAIPYGTLVQGSDGSLYGTTVLGGTGWVPKEGGAGTVFKITMGGQLTSLYSFCSQTLCLDGSQPYTGLMQATNGNFYGTTSAGGARNHGIVFEITPSGTFTTLYSFCAKLGCSDGVPTEVSYAGLVQAINGNFYGTTVHGGAHYIGGTVFKITPAGTLTTLYSFCSQTNCSDGGGPSAGLVQAANGNFYGTTVDGGAHYSGTVFKITSAGALTTLYSFCSQPNCTDGNLPLAGLVQAANGNFYGTTASGGAHNGGTVFKITPAGTLTTLYSFCSQTNCTDGSFPQAGLVQATDGKLYGTTSRGGAIGDGTVFSLALTAPVAE